MRKLIAPALVLPVLVFMLFGGSSCRKLEPGGVYQGDTLLMEAESLATDGYDALHAFVTWENENRALLKNTKVTQHANYVRKNAKQWISSLVATRDAYVGDPTGPNRTKLEQVMSVVRAAMAQALIYMQTNQTP